MPRKMTPEARAQNVALAAEALPMALAAALAGMTDPDATEAERHRLWEVVETHGATIHRQARLLAGKARGG